MFKDHTILFTKREVIDHTVKLKFNQPNVFATQKAECNITIEECVDRTQRQYKTPLTGAIKYKLS